MYSIAVILVRNKYNSSIAATVFPLPSNSFVIYERTLKSIASLTLRLVSIKPLTPKHYAGTMVLTMLCCGLRPIEIRRMKWDWIDFDNAILTVGKSKTEAGTGRKIPIPPVLLDALKEHKAKGLNNEYVFVKYEKHTRMDDNAFYQSWKNFVKKWT